ncbi:MAG: response regulator [Brasilonema octagenarum HA4186-MV1]|jgi:CheY-like chemotaxis protein|uniref:Response regulator n=1 Tax=Brasilonema sennae CENA114 TaxID=415709 RepID=A0A856MNQ1_9CYAN|nr:response regulator [Brasilonema sennae]MBW4629295.1 response regulator [Brasilonema octagenarum HA4186-MV1]QDL11754.1 response regulator [Brasilonema sennae CENA114]QDL18134.1 response regulator [Brasilonema octagenarum UFV-E1]
MKSDDSQGDLAEVSVIVLKSFDNQYPEDDINVKTLNNLRIIVVDDNIDTLILITVILEDYGAKVMTATSASEALEVIRDFELDFLIIDIVMPQEDGYSLIGKIRTLENTQKKAIPAIALTAVDTDEARQLAFKSGFQNYLTKPFDNRELVIEIANFLVNCN